jgi:alkanesulfonate monooxygenase SsuD/methylene tetrahydromethanopterin reductase-like flavin-dependent oxidoreductase (luciferase family)
MWYMHANKVPPQFVMPPGYVPVEAEANAMRKGSLYDFSRLTLEQAMAQGIVFAGNPDSVFKQIKAHYEHVGGYGHLLLMGQAGFLDHRETVRGIDRFARDVEPRLRELA